MHRGKNSTYMMFTPTPTPLVINIIVASTSYSPLTILSTAAYTNIPVTTHMSRTDTVAPIT